MQCRQCGTEIADKAIVCFRCGTPTTDPLRRPVQIRRRRSPLLSFVAIAALLLIALYQGYARETAPNPVQLSVAFLAATAVVILTMRLIRRRR